MSQPSSQSTQPTTSSQFASLTEEQVIESFEREISAGNVGRTNALAAEILRRMNYGVSAQTAVRRLTSTATARAQQNLQQSTIQSESLIKSIVDHAAQAAISAYFASLQQTQQQQQSQAQQTGTAQPPVAQPTLIPREIKLQPPDAFDGTASKLSNWAFNVRQYCVVSGITDGVCRQQVASRLLTGKAATWWRSKCDRATAVGDDLLTTWDLDDLIDNLQEAFRDVDQVNRLRGQLANLKQTTSVANYTYAFRKIIIELGDQAPTDGDQLYAYINGLKPAIRFQLSIHRPTLLSTAEQMAESMDQAMYGTRVINLSPAPKQQKQQSRNMGYAPMDIDLLQQQGSGGKKWQKGKGKWQKGKQQHGQHQQSYGNKQTSHPSSSGTSHAQH